MNADDSQDNPHSDSNPSSPDQGNERVESLAIKEDNFKSETSERQPTTNTDNSEIKKELIQIKQQEKMKTAEIISIALNFVYVITTIIIAVITYKGIKISQRAFESTSTENKERFE